MIEFVGGPLCGHPAKIQGTITLVAVKAPAYSYAMYSAEEGYRAVDPTRCEIGDVENIGSPMHIYAYEAMGAAGFPVLMYQGLR